MIRQNGYDLAEDLIPEFERVITEAQPDWWCHENVIGAPIPNVPGYLVNPAVLNNRWLGHIQSRVHRFSFGTRNGRRLDFETVALEAPVFERRVLAKHDALPRRRRNKDGTLTLRKAADLRPRSIAEGCILQGLPKDFFAHSPFTVAMQRQMLGNAVPLPMGLALARAIRAAIT